MLPSKVANLEPYLKAVTGKSGIEIGGPSPVFNAGDILPLYPRVSSLDCLNFSNHTIWEGHIISGPKTYQFDKSKSPGTRFIGEATKMPVDDASYDFLLSSHCLEHSANPLSALYETVRVLRPGGYALYILPWKQGTFDHRRSVTSFEHLVTDYENNVTEGDLTHLDEILQLHDLDKDKPAGNLEQFRVRCMDNLKHRAMHQHVFDESLLRQCFTKVCLTVEAFDMVRPFHQIILGQKPL